MFKSFQKVHPPLLGLAYCFLAEEDLSYWLTLLWNHLSASLRFFSISSSYWALISCSSLSRSDWAAQSISTFTEPLCLSRNKWRSCGERGGGKRAVSLPKITFDSCWNNSRPKDCSEMVRWPPHGSSSCTAAPHSVQLAGSPGLQWTASSLPEPLAVWPNLLPQLNASSVQSHTCHSQGGQGSYAILRSYPRPQHSVGPDQYIWYMWIRFHFILTIPLMLHVHVY